MENAVQAELTNVMVVDDSAADQFLSEIELKNEFPDINILKAIDGQQALDILSSSQTHPQVIFLDINMPGMDGHEFLEEYNKLYDEQASIVIMLTTSDQQVDKDRSSAFACVKKYFRKPLDSSVIAEVSSLIAAN
jgi:CheY-like chemotaxis protein